MRWWKVAIAVLAILCLLWCAGVTGHFIWIPGERDPRLVGDWKARWAEGRITERVTFRADGTGLSVGRGRFTWGTRDGRIHIKYMAVDAWSNPTATYAVDGATVRLDRGANFLLSRELRRISTPDGLRAYTQRDLEVIEAALASPQHWGSERVILFDRTEDAEGMLKEIGPSGLQSSRAVPTEEMVDDVKARNREPVSLKGAEFYTSWIQLRPTKTSVSDVEFATGWVGVVLPGYSKDGKNAMVLRRYGDKPRGVEAVMVRLREGRWEVDGQ